MNDLRARNFGRSTKLQSSCERLYELAQRLGPGAKLPSVVELRTELEVSLSTLSAALQQLESRNIIERRHGIGIYVSPLLHRRSVSLICNASFVSFAGHSPFWEQLLDQARQRATAGNSSFEIHFSQPDGAIGAPLQRGLAREISERQVDGVVGISLNAAATQWIEAQGVPFVVLFGPTFHSRSAAVALNEWRGVELGIRDLHARGCQHLALWTPFPAHRLITTHDIEDTGTIACFHRELSSLGLEFQPALVRRNTHLAPVGSSNGISHQEQGYATANEVFLQPRSQWPDGIVITDDMMAHGALMALAQLGLQVGKDVQFATHANKNSTVLMGHNATMTLLEYDPAYMVEVVFERLEALMRGETPRPSHLEIAPSVVPYSSGKNR